MLTRFFAFATPACVAASLAMPTAAALVDFDTAGDLANNFTITGAMTQSPTGGAGNSGSVTPPAADATAVYNQDTFAFDTGETATISMLLKKGPTPAGGSRALQLGFGNGTSSLFTNGTSSFLSARIDSSTGATAGQMQLAVQTRDGSALTTNAQGSAFSLTNGNFYLFTVNITKTGDSSFVLDGSVVDQGIDGLTPGATIASFTDAAVTNNTLGGSGTTSGLNAAFRSNASAGAAALDNFSANAGPIPEPGSLGLIGLGALSLVARRRR